METITRSDSTATNANSDLGQKKLSFGRVSIYGVGNFASNLSWTMVTTYLAVYYTDAVRLSAIAVASILLAVRIFDAVMDPLVGMITERTHSRWGRFRPYMLFGAPVLAVMIILTFSNPGFSGAGKTIYVILTYLCLSLSYSVVNVSYMALPYAITRNRVDMPRLFSANLIGMNIGQIVLNLLTLKLVGFFGKGNESVGYQKTAILFAVVAMFLFWGVVAGSREVVKVSPKKEKLPLNTSFKVMFQERNINLQLIYSFLSGFGIMGRIGTMLYYYLYVIQRPDLAGVFMSLPTIVGIFACLGGPWLTNKVGRKKTVYIGQVGSAMGLVILFFAGGGNLGLVILGNIIYGAAYIAGPGGNSLMRDAIDKCELRTGVRIDGTINGVANLINKITNAAGASIALYIIGAAGYVAGHPVSAATSFGINCAANLMPAAVVLLSIIPIIFYNITEEEAKKTQEQLVARQLASEASSSNADK